MVCITDPETRNLLSIFELSKYEIILKSFNSLKFNKTLEVKSFEWIFWLFGTKINKMIDQILSLILETQSFVIDYLCQYSNKING
jgi:hypothetical protein